MRCSISLQRKLATVLRYSEAVAGAPPGAATFQPEDLLRLDRWALALLLGGEPGCVPVDDVASALDADSLARLAGRVPASIADALLEARPAPDRDGARRRVTRGAFWLLVYLLEPDRWDALSRAEELPASIVEALPTGRRVLEVAAGSGRLTCLLAGRPELVLVAVEPSAPLRALLRRRVPEAKVVAGLGQALPVRDGWADLVVSCAAFGPDEPWGGERVCAELERCAAPGGTVALVGPEQPAWFEARGYRQTHFRAGRRRAPDELADFFGPRLQPPCELLLKRL